MATHDDFLRSFKLLVGHEGGFTDDPRDAGNWTGGKTGQGQLKGTKYGISAASYPALDIKNLQLNEAQAIYEKDFWEAVGCSDLPPRLAFAVFDAAVNNGTVRAVRWLQLAVGAAEDGIYGPATKVRGRARDRRRPGRSETDAGIARAADPLHGRALRLVD